MKKTVTAIILIAMVLLCAASSFAEPKYYAVDLRKCDETLANVYRKTYDAQKQENNGTVSDTAKIESAERMTTSDIRRNETGKPGAALRLLSVLNYWLER